MSVHSLDKRYPVHTLETAPEGATAALQGLQGNFGFIPNLAATMAASPALLNSFVAVFGQFHGSSFNDAERQVLLLTNAVTNRSAWAVAFHSTLALGAGVDPADVDAIRRGERPGDHRYASLWTLTRALIENRGHIDEATRAGFVYNGFTDAQVFDVIAGLAVSTMANYAGNVADPVVEERFAAQRWSPQNPVNR